MTTSLLPPPDSEDDGLNGLSIPELKQHLDKVLDADDAFLALLLGAALRTAASVTGRQLTLDPAVGADPVVKKLPIQKGRVRLPDAREIDSVMLDETELIEDTDFETVERDGCFVMLELHDRWCDQRRLGWRTRKVAVTGRFGLNGLPDDLRDAIYVMVAHNFHERDMGYADHVVAGEGVAAGAYYLAVPRRSMMVLATYRVGSDWIGLW